MSTAQTLAIAKQAFQRLTYGLSKGRWQPFLEMLTDDFYFWFPVGEFHGHNEGKARAEAFFYYVSRSYPEGLNIILDQVTSNETTAIFEIRTEGLLFGERYKNRVAIALDVRDGKICAYREYFGSDGKSA